MHETSVFWLRAAAALYAIGLFHTLTIAFRKSSTLFRPALVSFAAGAVVHLVSVVETFVEQGTWFPAGFGYSASVCALGVALVFLFSYWRFRVETLGLLCFPLVFVLTTVAALRMPLGSWTSTAARDTWLVTHIGLVLLAYAALLLTAFASVLYLLQERQLKRKRALMLFDRLPPLGTLDSLISVSLGSGFVLLTIGVVIGATWASIESRGAVVRDPRVTIAGVTWAFCFLTLLLRVTAGWRGRKAALMSVAVVAFSAATWAAHYVSH
ncbi:MAG TPA: cytochrome c biogenesis protein CcsA [Bryobacteraceae bacterium]|nr:cytochrome c biogenesis protein CcsA [Bryobacteraceae bacterium]